MEPLDRFPGPGPLQWQYELRACVLVLQDNHPSYIKHTEKSASSVQLPNCNTTSHAIYLKLHRGSKACSPYSAHIERPASSLHSHDKSSKAPTITRPHRAPAASFTEGPQRVLRVQPIEHLPSSSHNRGKSSNHHTTTQTTCCLLHGGSTVSPSCTTYRAPAIFLTYSWHVLQPSQDHTEHLLPP